MYSYKLELYLYDYVYVTPVVIHYMYNIQNDQDDARPEGGRLAQH